MDTQEDRIPVPVPVSEDDEEIPELVPVDDEISEHGREIALYKSPSSAPTLLYIRAMMCMMLTTGLFLAYDNSFHFTKRVARKKPGSVWGQIEEQRRAGVSLEVDPVRGERYRFVHTDGEGVEMDWAMLSPMVSPLRKSAYQVGRARGGVPASNRVVAPLLPAPSIFRGPPSTIPRSRPRGETAEASAAHLSRAEDLTSRIEAIQARIQEIDREIDAAMTPSEITATPSEITPSTSRQRRIAEARASAAAWASTSGLTPAEMTAERRRQAREARAATLYARPLGQPLRIRRPAIRSGSRQIREQPLKDADLWVDSVGPAAQVPNEPHHMCGICHMVKSHPVSYLCGHSHCYVCVRLWLEREWTCPECSKQMAGAPFRQYAEEKYIAAAYPDWEDVSRVEYSWEGLVFPKPAQVVVEDM
ncbi:hypothetical protein B0H11DRAFT_2255526 [Mycena galericulata]|nr:hypothetical protein B0H11DRAFT_2255526 [Mycena galericulata]